MEKQKSSWYLPADILFAMDLVYRKKGVLKSHQVEMGVRNYLKEHESFLQEEGIDVCNK